MMSRYLQIHNDFYGYAVYHWQVMSVRFSVLILFTFVLASCLGGGRSPAPAVHYGQGTGSGSAGVHAVSRGDTLYSISKRYSLSMQDLIVLNRLKAPFVLREGQRIKLPPPKEYRVKQGDTLYGVSRLFGVDSTQVARMNHMRSPYTLRVGQVIRLPSVAKRVTTSVSSASAKVAKVDRGAVESSAIRPSVKPVQKPVVRDGVPVPGTKPDRKVTKVSRIARKAPKRSSSKFLRPVRGRILSNYGAKKSGLHNDGINIAAARGTPVSAAENGVVVYTGNALKGSGNLILLRHDNRWVTAYAHLDSIGVRQGQVVKRGMQIGKVGSTGSVSSPQLHFEVRRGTAAMNPVKYME